MTGFTNNQNFTLLIVAMAIVGFVLAVMLISDAITSAAEAKAKEHRIAKVDETAATLNRMGYEPGRKDPQ